MALTAAGCGAGGSVSLESGLPPSAMEPETDEDLISEDDAIAIVLDRIDGASSSDITSFGLDFDEGRWHYKGEIRYDDKEYDFEIDAQNGNILDWEIDY